MMRYKIFQHFNIFCKKEFSTIMYAECYTYYRDIFYNYSVLYTVTSYGRAFWYLKIFSHTYLLSTGVFAVFCMEKNTFCFCCSFVTEDYYLFLVSLFIFIRANLYGKESQENILYFMLCSRWIFLRALWYILLYVILLFCYKSKLW